MMTTKTMSPTKALFFLLKLFSSHIYCIRNINNRKTADRHHYRSTKYKNNFIFLYRTKLKKKNPTLTAGENSQRRALFTPLQNYNHKRRSIFMYTKNTIAPVLLNTAKYDKGLQTDLVNTVKNDKGLGNIP